MVVVGMDRELPEGAPVMLRMSVERENGYLSVLGMQMEDIEFGKATLLVPFDEQLTDKESDPPTVHNGIAASLLEQAGELAIRTTLEDPVNDTVEPVSLDLNFLDEAAHDLVGTGEVIERKDGTAIASVTVEGRTPEGKREVIVTGQGVYRIET